MLSRRLRWRPSTAGWSWPICLRPRRGTGSTAIMRASRGNCCPPPMPRRSPAARRGRVARLASGRHPPGRAKLNPLGRPLLDPTMKETTSSDARPARWRLLALLIAMTGISSLSLNILVPAIPSMVTKFVADPASVQLTVSLYLLGLAVAQLVFGPLSDRFGRRPVVLGGLALATVASTAPIFAASVAGAIAA